MFGQLPLVNTTSILLSARLASMASMTSRDLIIELFLSAFLSSWSSFGRQQLHQLAFYFIFFFSFSPSVIIDPYVCLPTISAVANSLPRALHIKSCASFDALYNQVRGHSFSLFIYSIYSIYYSKHLFI